MGASVRNFGRETIADSKRASPRGSRPTPLLFVYGTLRPFADVPMARWLASVAEHLGPARTRGRLYDLGPYPALVDAVRRDEWVVGNLYRLKRPVTALRTLDDYEGGPNGRGEPEYERVERIVELGQFERTTAWLYLYRRSVLRARRIPSGDYADARIMSAVVNRRLRR